MERSNIRADYRDRLDFVQVPILAHLIFISSLPRVVNQRFQIATDRAPPAGGQMKIRVELISTLALITFVSAFLIPSANRLEATNQVRFFAFELGTLGGDNSEAHGINNRGQVVGSADVNTVLGIRHAFLWERGQMTDLGTFGGDGSGALGINERGQVVGFASVPPGSGPGHAFLWDNGNLQDLHPNGANASGARAINNRGQVVGSYTAQDETEHAALWDGGVMTDLGVPSNPASGALAINDAGQIVGHYRPAPNSFCSFLWDKGRVTTIGQCLSTALSFAFGINDRGDIVGVDPFSFLFRKDVNDFDRFARASCHQ